MSLLSNVVKSEIERIEKMIYSYENKLSTFPKGTLSKKKINNKVYYYLQYRDKNKTVSEYLSNNEDDISEVKEQIEQRQHIEKMLSALKDEYQTAKKMLEVAEK